MTQDAFPEAVAEQNGFQRRATVLVYLNDAPGGGRTRFDALDLAVQPVKGRALLFFPAFADGRPDPRYAARTPTPPPPLQPVLEVLSIT